MNFSFDKPLIGSNPLILIFSIRYLICAYICSSVGIYTNLVFLNILIFAWSFLSIDVSETIFLISVNSFDTLFK